MTNDQWKYSTLYSSGSEKANNYHQVQSFRRKLNTNWNFSSNVGIIFWELYERTKGFLGGKVNGQFCWNDGKPPNNEICLHNGWNFHRKSGISRKAMVLDNCDFSGPNDFLDQEWEGWMCGTILRILQKRFFFMWCRPCQYRSKIPPSPISTVIERYKTFCKSLHWTMRICNSFSNFTFQLEFCKRQRYTLELICFIFQQDLIKLD